MRARPSGTGDSTLGATTLSGTRTSNFALAFVERVVGGRELAVGEAIGGALRGFGPVLLEVEQHLALAGGEAPGLACGVLALPSSRAGAAPGPSRGAGRLRPCRAHPCASGAARLAGFGENADQPPPKTVTPTGVSSTMRSTCSSRSRSWLATRAAPRHCVDQSEDRRAARASSRLLVGSSSRRMSGASSQRRATAMRVRSPPLKPLDGAGEVALREIDIRERFGDAVFECPVGFGHVLFGAVSPRRAERDARDHQPLRRGPGRA
jgi:hypothetical protein